MVTLQGKTYESWAHYAAALAAPAPSPVIEPPAEIEPPAPEPSVFSPAPARPGKRLPISERYRPRRLSQVVGQDRALRQIRLAARDNGDTFGGAAWWISGESGQGKTTVARCIAATLASDAFVTEYNAADVTPADVARIQDEASMFGWGRGGRAFILNESHGLRRDTVRKLLVALEPIPSHVCWIFTTTCAGMDKFEDEQIDALPLLSRCQVVALNADTAAPAFARLAQRVARREHLDGQPIDAYRELVKSKRGNMRAVYQSIAGGLMLK